MYLTAQRKLLLMVNAVFSPSSSQFRRIEQLTWLTIVHLLHLYHNVASVPRFDVTPLQNVCRGALISSPSPQLGTSAWPPRPRVLLLLLLLFDPPLSLERGSLHWPDGARSEGQSPAPPPNAAAVPALDPGPEVADGGRGALAERPRQPPLSLRPLDLPRDFHVGLNLHLVFGCILDARGLVLPGEDPLVPRVRVSLGHGARRVKADAADHGAELR